jgi:S-adenosylmethionine:tRNA ribosyltransferase-isomerase
MRVSDFDYELPRELIAQEPAERRDASRLMVLHRSERRIEHRRFPDLLKYLQPGDCLVVNDTKVIPARLVGRRVGSGGTAELLLLRADGGNRWEVLCRPARRLRPGAQVGFGDGELMATVVGELDDGRRVVEFKSERPLREALERLGQVPLPPYITRAPLPADRERYQTVYARAEGAVAAPTAGLHFTPELLEAIRGQGVRIATITLHVGLGTFRPVECERVEEHTMHSEQFQVTAEAAQTVNGCRGQRGRVVAVGTTVVRALESAADETGTVMPTTGEADLFITPGHRFRAVDMLLTNFHLPRSTLLMLVSAFAGREFVLRAYSEAVRQRYRFYSYGDAMLIL